MSQDISLEKTKLSLVPKDRIKSVLNSFGLVIEKDMKTEEEIIYISEEDRINFVPAKCSGCGTEMTTATFGHLAKGSKLLYCKNPVCFDHYLALNKIKEGN